MSAPSPSRSVTPGGGTVTWTATQFISTTRDGSEVWVGTWNCSGCRTTVHKRHPADADEHAGTCYRVPATEEVTR